MILHVAQSLFFFGYCVIDLLQLCQLDIHGLKFRADLRQKTAELAWHTSRAMMFVALLCLLVI